MKNSDLQNVRKSSSNYIYNINLNDNNHFDFNLLFYATHEMKFCFRFEKNAQKWNKYFYNSIYFVLKVNKWKCNISLAWSGQCNKFLQETCIRIQRKESIIFPMKKTTEEIYCACLKTTPSWKLLTAAGRSNLM